MSDEESTGRTFTAFLLGAAVGVVAGLLFAPRAGRQNRERLKDWAKELEDTADELLHEGREKGEALLREAVQQGKEKIKKTVNDARSKINDPLND